MPRLNGYVNHAKAKKQMVESLLEAGVLTRRGPDVSLEELTDGEFYQEISMAKLYFASRSAAEKNRIVEDILSKMDPDDAMRVRGIANKMMKSFNESKRFRNGLGELTAMEIILFLGIYLYVAETRRHMLPENSHVV